MKIKTIKELKDAMIPVEDLRSITTFSKSELGHSQMSTPMVGFVNNKETFLVNDYGTEIARADDFKSVYRREENPLLINSNIQSKITDPDLHFLCDVINSGEGSISIDDLGKIANCFGREYGRIKPEKKLRTIQAHTKNGQREILTELLNN
jgi:hypothetical protein